MDEHNPGMLPCRSRCGKVRRIAGACRGDRGHSPGSGSGLVSLLAGGAARRENGEYEATGKEEYERFSHDVYRVPMDAPAGINLSPQWEEPEWITLYSGNAKKT